MAEMFDNKTTRMPDPTARTSQSTRATWIVPIIVVLIVVVGFLYKSVTVGRAAQDSAMGTGNANVNSAIRTDSPHTGKP